MMAPLSRYFTLEEMTKTDTGFINVPNQQELENLSDLCADVLDKVRILCGPIIVSSGYRSSEVNSFVGGARGSQHLYGMAADIQSRKLTPKELFQRIMDADIQYDQLILEFDRWVHISYNGLLNRQMALHATIQNGNVVYVSIEGSKQKWM